MKALHESDKFDKALDVASASYQVIPASNRYMLNLDDDLLKLDDDLLNLDDDLLNLDDDL